MVFCESILDELKLNLRTSDNDSDLLARRTLEAICRNRLVPTTWLNKVRHVSGMHGRPAFLRPVQHYMHSNVKQ